MEQERNLPVNVRQVGSADPGCTVYVEDYVETYIRKQKYTEKKPVVTGYLYGKTLETEGEAKYLIFGAIEDHKLTKERGRDRGKKYFGEYLLMGCFVKGEKDKLPPAEEQNRLMERLGLQDGSVLYIGDGENSVMLSRQSGTLFPLSGHLIFYERNEAMQEYMVQTGEGKSIEAETIDQAAVHFREIMQKKEEVLENPVRKRVGSGGLVKAASVLAVCLLGGSLIFAGNDTLRKEAFSWVREFVEEKTEKDIAVNLIPGEVEPTEKETAETKPVETSPVETEPLPTEPSATEPPAVEPSAGEPAENPLPQETIPPETVPTGGGADHVVVIGETLHGILKRHYGNEFRLQEICQLNGIENPDEIFEGQVIHLP